uniref:Uncharacterized protein n=1 Tax=Triticum urartu TaxID=4572 RepID=A0A8R7RA94_TRIUA
MHAAPRRVRRRPLRTAFPTSSGHRLQLLLRDSSSPPGAARLLCMRRRQPTHAGQGLAPGHGWAPLSLISSLWHHLSQIQAAQHCRAPTRAPVPHCPRAS